MPEVGVDTRFLVALYALAVESFGNGKPAAMPRPAAGFTLEDLRFYPADEAEDKTRALQFAMLVNYGYRPPIATAEPGFLWDAYAAVLDPSLVMLAEREPTAEESARHDEAVALLTPDAMATYTECQHAVGMARLQRSQQELLEPTRDDPAWTSWKVQMDLADQAVTSAIADLQTRGRQAEVEAALAVVANWSTAANLVAWSHHASDLELALDGAPDGTDYALTTFVPSDVAEGKGWLRFELPPERVDGLIGSLDEHLRSLAAMSPGARPVKRVTVELAHVTLQRPWLDAAIFASHAWRWSAADRPAVSDGMEPATGSFPYFVSGLVLARSLKIEFEPEAGGQGHAPVVTLELKKFNYLRASTAPVALHPRTASPSIARLRPAVLATPSATASPSMLRSRLLGSVRTTILARLPGRFAQPTAQPVATARVHALKPISPAVLAAIKARDFASPAVSISAVPPPAAPSAEVLVPESEAIIVAYLLTKLDRSPDPDPSLSWPGT